MTFEGTDIVADGPIGTVYDKKTQLCTQHRGSKDLTLVSRACHADASFLFICLLADGIVFFSVQF